MSLASKVKKCCFAECYKENLGFWECPSFLFFVMGLFTILMMAITYILSNAYGSPEIVIASLLLVTVVLIIIGYSVSQTVSRIGFAKRTAEYEKRKSESIIANLTDGLVMLSRDLNIIMVNQRAEHYLRQREENLLGKNINNKALFAKYPRLKYFFGYTPPNKTALTKPKKEQVKIAESDEFFDIYTISIIDADRRLLGYIKVIHDVTREKTIDQMKTEFISIASHQLRTPLSGIKWTIELLLNDRLGKATGEQKEALQRMDESNDGLISLVEHLLNVSRIEQGRMKMEITRGNFEGLVLKQIKLLKPKADSKKIKLEFNKSGGEPYLANFDQEKLSFVVQNLIDNAIKYTNTGGKVIIEITKDQPRGEMRLCVKDSGIGIPRDEASKIFSKFFRASNAKTSATEGTGLGLNIAKNIIEKHCGKIWFVSQEHQGTAFYITLPLK